MTNCLRNDSRCGRIVASLVFVAQCAYATSGEAQYGEVARAKGTPNPTYVPSLERVGVDEHLLGQLPMDAEVTRHDGRTMRFGQLFRGKPVLLTFVYHSCKTMCGLVQNSTVDSLKRLSYRLGEDFDAITVSIDPRNTAHEAAKARAKVLQMYGSAVSLGPSGNAAASGGWHYVVAQQEAIDGLTRAAGFRYFYDQKQDEYAHPGVIMLVTPTGKIARYLYGLMYNPLDLRLGIAEAKEGRAVSTIEHVLLYCYSYDPKASGYVLMASRVMKIGGAITMIAMLSVLLFFWRREIRRGKAEPATPDVDSHTVQKASA